MANMICPECGNVCDSAGRRTCGHIYTKPITMKEYRERREIYNKGQEAVFRSMGCRASSMIATNDMELYGKVCRNDTERARISRPKQ